MMALGLLCAIVCTAALTAIAAGAARSYELHFAPFDARAMGVVAFVAPSCAFAWRSHAHWTFPLVAGIAAAAAATDIQTGYVFDRVLLAGSAAIAAISIASGSEYGSLGGGAVEGAGLLLPYLASRRGGMGFGDVKLGAVLGLGLGMPSAAVALWVALVSGGLVAAAALCLRHARRDSELRFAPFLAMGAACAMAVLS